MAEAQDNVGHSGALAIRVVLETQIMAPILLELGAKSGVPSGDTHAELISDQVIAIFFEGYKAFDGTSFTEALRRAGLAPPGNAADFDKGYFQSYTKERLEAILKFLKDTRASGQAWDSKGQPQPLKENQKKCLEEAAKDIQKLIDWYPKVEEPAQAHGFDFLGLSALVTPAASWIGGAILLAVSAIIIFYVGGWLWRRWQARASTAPQAFPKSNPELSPEVLSRYRRIELSAQRIATAMTHGAFRSMFMGAGGTDFAEARPYVDEDRREIDWKATARVGQLHVRKFELEKDMPLMLLVDLSASSQFGTRQRQKRQVIEDLASLLALTAATANLRVGAVIVTDKVEVYIPPQSGLNHAREIMRRVMTFETKSQGTDLKPALTLALGELHSRAIVAVISDFVAPDFKGELAALAGRHDLRLIAVTDPAENEPLPPVGLVLVKDAETGAVRTIDTSNKNFRAEHAAILARRESERQSAFAAARTRPITLSTEGDPLETLTQELTSKKR